MAERKPKVRKVGYITLKLQKDDPDGWVLNVERIDPFGGTPFIQDYWFEEKGQAQHWFKHIHGNEDIILLHQHSDLPPIGAYELPGSFAAS